LIVVGLTGSLSSGKSEAARVFKTLGAKVFDADLAAKRAVKKGTPAYAAILKLFGREYLAPGRELDRKKLAQRVFHRPADLKKLNILIHPGVIFECLKVIEGVRNKKGVLVMDVPLLFESRMENLADVTIVVAASMERMLERSKKKGLPRELAKKILSTQWPMAKKAKLADFVIDNNGTARELAAKVKKVYSQIKATE